MQPEHSAGQQQSELVPVTDSGVSNADVDEFTTGGNSLGRNAAVSRDARAKK